MPIELWLAYVATCAVILAIPGPTILVVLSYAISYGKRATLPVVAGVALGDTVAISLSLVGLGGLLATSALWFTMIKWLGGLYLIYLGVKLFRGAAATRLEPSDKRETPRKLFTKAFIVTALNPKSIVFFIAFLPQFISHDHPVTPQLWILGITFVSLAIVGATSYALFASAMREFLSSVKAQKIYGMFGGSLLCIAGIWALTSKRALSAG
jgi:threonine/homoserine/homoserine lactone efflux protein